MVHMRVTDKAGHETGFGLTAGNGSRSGSRRGGRRLYHDDWNLTVTGTIYPRMCPGFT
jgi:hypothetical protein